MNNREKMQTSTGLKLTRNGDHAWTARDGATDEVLGHGNTRAAAVLVANRIRIRRGTHPYVESK